MITYKTCNASVSFHFSDNTYPKTEEGNELFQQLADHDYPANCVFSSLLFPNAQNRDLSVLSSNGKAYNFDHVSFAYKSL